MIYYFPKCHKGMFSSFYTPSNWIELENLLIDFVREIDPNKENRAKEVADFCKRNDGAAGKWITV